MRSAMNLRIINESTPNCCRLICRKVCWVCSGFLLSDSPKPSQLHDNRSLKSSIRLRYDPQTGRITTRFEYSSQRPQSLGYPCGRIIDDLTVCVQTLFFFLIAIFLVFKFLSDAQCIPVSMESQGKLICFQLGDCMCFCYAGYKYLNIIPV